MCNQGLFSSKNIIMQIVISKYTPRLEYLSKESFAVEIPENVNVEKLICEKPGSLKVTF